MHLQPSLRGRAAVLAPALIVGACAVAATAHGGYEVAVACQVPAGFVSALYPLITDGLALVAYAATHRLPHRTSRTYAWAVVVLAAGLSGLAQAVYLASGPALVTDPALRFGVGAWPAIAGAVAAHLVYLLAARPGAVGDSALADPQQAGPPAATVGVSVGPDSSRTGPASANPSAARIDDSSVNPPSSTGTAVPSPVPADPPATVGEPAVADDLDAARRARETERKRAQRAKARAVQKSTARRP